MPKPVGSDQRYMPGLDGLRAIAVLAVIAFHVQFGWAPGGLLGVGIFFTLSGYLITDLLLNRWTASGRLHLAEFWMRRARRLLPALFVMLAVVTAWVTIADRVRLASLRGAVGAASTYWSNWYVIIKGQSYFARFAPPQPLDHLWSLAVEEQFYLIWPWLLLAGVFLIRRRGASALPWLALPTLAMAAASAVAAVLLYRPGFDPTRIYEGTDTRASGLLIGAALAMLWSSRRAAVTGKTGQRLLDWPGFAGLAVIGIMIWRVGQYSPFLYRGGLVVLALATAAVVAAAACPATLTAKALGWRPLRWLGVRSYGIYLWHFPVIVLTTPANSTEDLPRAAAQVAATIAIAAVSWRYIEEPVRRGAIGRAWQELRSRRLPSMAPASIAAAGATVGVLVVASVGLAGAISAPAGASSGTALALGATSGGTASSVTQVHGSDPTGGQQKSTPAAASPPAHAATGQRIGSGGLLPVSLRDRPRPLMTSCQSVVHIGDSTSEGLVSPNYLPNWRQRIPAQYEDVGVHTVYTNITGARSVVEVLPGTTNAYDAAKGLVAQGFHGCWVLALGTNDTADVAVGSNVGPTTRINRMMSATHGGPVMWIEVVSLLSSGPYAEANMAKWNAALLKACARYPNMRVFDWPALAKRSWFISDGIHYTSAGYAVRGHDIAQGLATAFPAGGSSSGCVVS
jgi:peptidoglycan/LPS O-acetylase OafA/YrhL/lysophospholipase L1-like esterase